MATKSPKKKPTVGNDRPGDNRQGETASDPNVPAELKKHPFFRTVETRLIQRSSIIPAPYNPRQIDLNAKIKLKQGLREFGCVEALVWNELTGNLVGGHQRLKIMDEEVNYPASGEDYAVEVSVVRLNSGDEKTLNVLLNNPGAQGWWDWQPLKEMIAGEKEFDAELAGFDPVLLKAQFDQFTAPDDGLDLSHIFGEEKIDPAKADADAIATMKATKEDYKAAEGELSKEGFYMQVVGRTTGEKEKFCEALGYSTFTKSVELRDFFQRINKLIERGKPIDIGWSPPADPSFTDEQKPTVAAGTEKNAEPEQKQESPVGAG